MGLLERRKDMESAVCENPERKVLGQTFKQWLGNPAKLPFGFPESKIAKFNWQGSNSLEWAVYCFQIGKKRLENDD